MDGITDITVFLSTTTNIILGSSEKEGWLKSDIPICSVISQIDIPLKKIDKKKLLFLKIYYKNHTNCKLLKQQSCILLSGRDKVHIKREL
jgi:hypothetical protein